MLFSFPNMAGPNSDFFNFYFLRVAEEFSEVARHAYSTLARSLGLRGAPLLESRIDFVCAVESWERAVESWAADRQVLNRFFTYKY